MCSNTGQADDAHLLRAVALVQQRDDIPGVAISAPPGPSGCVRGSRLCCILDEARQAAGQTNLLQAERRVVQCIVDIQCLPSMERTRTPCFRAASLLTYTLAAHAHDVGGFHTKPARATACAAACETGG